MSLDTAYEGLVLSCVPRCGHESSGSSGAVCAASLYSTHHSVQSPEALPYAEDRPGVASQIHRYV